MANDETLAEGQQESAEVGPASDSSPPRPSYSQYRSAGHYTWRCEHTSMLPNLYIAFGYG